MTRRRGAGCGRCVTAILWGTMSDRFGKIETILKKSAPMNATLTRRVSDLPPLAALAVKAREDYGDAYCGGKIEASLRKALGAHQLDFTALTASRPAKARW